MAEQAIPFEAPEEAAAQAAPIVAVSVKHWRPSAGKALKRFGGAFLTFASTVGLMYLTDGARYVALVGLGATTAFFALGVGHGVIALVRIKRSPQPVPGGWTAAIAIFPTFLGFVLTLFGAALTLLTTMNFGRGRQLRRRGKVLLPPVEAGGDWAGLSFDDLQNIESETRSALAKQWRENGRTEHASVAAFARLTLDLMMLGAPASLIESANADARDEIRHTELCFSLARALDGKTESPGAFPEAGRARSLPGSRELALAQLAVDSLIDGALHEGVSARVLALLAKKCEVPAVREVLRELAADEGRHAKHGWDVVEWCVAEGGEPVALALRGAIRALPEHIQSDLPEGARGGAWERFGIHGAALEIEEHARARADIVRRAGAIAARR